MSDMSKAVSDIKQAAEQVDSQQIDNNLKNTSHSNTAEELSEEERTPFIEDELRTDK